MNCSANTKAQNTTAVCGAKTKACAHMFILVLPDGVFGEPVTVRVLVAEISDNNEEKLLSLHYF